MADLTPMMRQYYQIKDQAKDCILFFRLGDFYEMFGEDALEASEILGITLTSRSKGDKAMPMCGVPYHAAAGYIAKLTRVGKKVAICEQLSDPTLPGIVKREIVRIVTPGTTLDENVLEDRSANFLMAVTMAGPPNGADSGAFHHSGSPRPTVYIGLALVEMSTGEFETMVAADELELMAAFRKYLPKEIIYPTDKIERVLLDRWKKSYDHAFWFAEKLPENWRDTVDQHFGVLEISNQNLSIEEMTAAGLALNYLYKTQKTGPSQANLGHLKNIQARSADLMTLDEATIRNLEIVENLRDKKLEGSLLSVLDKTITSAGARMMKKLLVEPLNDLAMIEARLDIIDLLMAKQNLLLDLRLALKGVMDIERILGRLSLGSGGARDIRGLINSFEALRKLSQMMREKCPELIERNIYQIKLLPELISELGRAVVDEPPFSVKEGGLIREGYNQELDSLRSLSREGKNYIQALQTREIQRTGIHSLKVRFNRVFGYYIEVSNANLAQVPEDYTRKQTLANAERFSTPELKEYEEKVLTAEEKIMVIEAGLFEELRQRILAETAAIKESAAAAAYLDVMVSLALVSWENRYTRPQISDSYDLRLIAGRHPVIEKLNPQDKFVPNDTILKEDQRMALITGPNMGGKSTFLRQTAIIVLMAHLGMYVPADQAIIPLVDRIFTRVGASDNLVKGQSTFWLEMEETALILRQATKKSLIVLDEIGRGTSTFDGVSIAWGIMEYVHDKIGAKTLFASHYHELISLADNLPRAANFCVKIQEGPDGVVFLYQVGAGGVDRSYGIEVARLAGLPDQVISRAKEILADLEKENIGTGQQSFSFDGQEPGGISDSDTESVRADFQRQNLAVRSHAGLEKLRNLNLDQLTPLEALNQLHDLKNALDEVPPQE